MDGPPLDPRIARLLESLRQEPSSGPGRGIARFGATLRGAAGIAGGVWRSRRRGREGDLDEAELQGIEELVKRLGKLKGLPMKAGQILGYLQADLPEELRQMLAVLQTQSQPTPFEAVGQVLREDLGERSAALLERMDRSPASAASIGQVHRAELPDGTKVAVKILHAGIEEAIRSDFSGAAAGSAFASLLVPGAGAMAREFVDEARTRLIEECDYRLEAQRQSRFRTLFRNHSDIVVPEVLSEWSSARVLTTVWEDGREFDSFALNASLPDRDRVGRALFDFYIGTLYRHGLFHADPHPGNYRLREDGRIVVFDYGCVREFEPAAVRAFADLADAVRRGDERGIRDALRGLGAAPPANPKTFAHIHGLLRGFFGPLLRPGPQPIDARVAIDARQMARDKLAMARLRLPGKLLFLFRIRFGLYSVISRLGSVADWSALEQQFAAEWGGSD